MESTSRTFLECEKHWVFRSLMFVGGFYGGYTYGIRGGIFCNAQTANLLLLTLNLGNGDFRKASHYLLPFIAYLSGTILSEIFAKEIKRLRLLRWDTLLVGIELITVILLGVMPATWPDQICQISLNFICAMQFNTFRQAEGIGMATTFCTNHLRQFGSFLVRYCRTGDAKLGRTSRLHGEMILMFCLGVLAATLLIRVLQYQAIFGAAAVLLYTFIRLLIADRSYEKALLQCTPKGH